MTMNSSSSKTFLELAHQLIILGVKQVGWMTVAGTLLGFLSFVFPLELMSHLRIPYLIVIFLVLLFCIAIRIFDHFEKPDPAASILMNKKILYTISNAELVIFAVVLALNAALILPMYFKNSSGQEGSSETGKSVRLKLLQVNLLEPNTNYEAVCRYVVDEAPDIVSFEEVGIEWGNELGKQLKDYPYRQINSENGYFGMAIFSKFPFESEKLIMSRSGIQALLAKIKVAQDVSLAYLAVHALPPIQDDHLADRNQEMANMAILRKTYTGNFVLAGDLNCSPWSNAFSDLCKNGNLRDSQQGFGPQPSWPSYFGVPFIPIDHFLVSPEVKVLSRSVGPQIGSDHYPVSATIEISRKSASGQSGD